MIRCCPEAQSLSKDISSLYSCVLTHAIACVVYYLTVWNAQLTTSISHGESFSCDYPHSSRFMLRQIRQRVRARVRVRKYVPASALRISRSRMNIARGGEPGDEARENYRVIMLLLLLLVCTSQVVRVGAMVVHNLCSSQIGGGARTYQSRAPQACGLVSFPDRPGNETRPGPAPKNGPGHSQATPSRDCKTTNGSGSLSVRVSHLHSHCSILHYTIEQ